MYATVAEFRGSGSMGVTAQATTTALPDAQVQTLIVRASRFFDQLCGVFPGYFETAADAASSKTFYGSGTKYLALDPYVPGSLNLSISLPTGYAVPDFIQKGLPPNQFLIVSDANGVFSNLSTRIPQCAWQEGVPVTISAKWGFAATPEDVKLAVIELAVNLWRELDPANIKLVNLEGQPLREKYPPRVNEIAKRYRIKAPAFV